MLGQVNRGYVSFLELGEVISGKNSLDQVMSG
jgi:hypothetical protein